MFTCWVAGYRNWADQHFKGAFDEVTIWNRALTPAEIKQLFLANTQQVSFVSVDTRAVATPVRNVRQNTPDATAPPPPQRPAAPPPAVITPKLRSYAYDSKTAKGTLSVDIADGGLETRDWVIKNIGKIASSKELLLEAGKEPTAGGLYKVLNETLKDGILTVEFEVLH
ncbi:MAG: LamG-like jellyroll fold domain-containing protein [bacterium]